jgi:CBS domain-containing protein
MLVAADVMTTDVITVSPETTVRDIAILLHAKRISGVPVADAARNILGIVTEGDLVRQEAVAGKHRRSWWLALFDDPTNLARD